MPVLQNIYVISVTLDVSKPFPKSSVNSADSAINLELQEKIWQILDEDSEIDGGVTRLTTGDLALRIFGHRAQKLQQVAEKIKKLYETEQI